MVSNPAYKAIIDMGENAVPLLLELRKKPDHWLVALNRIQEKNRLSRRAHSRKHAMRIGLGPQERLFAMRDLEILKKRLSCFAK